MRKIKNKQRTKITKMYWKTIALKEFFQICCSSGVAGFLKADD